MICVTGISKNFGAFQALNNVSFKAEAGQGVGVVGENGSGKSTLMRILCSEEIPDQGSIEIDADPPRAFLVHQELALCPHLTVAENIFLGRLGILGFSPRQTIRNAQQILNRLGFPECDAGSKVESLPISMRQVVEIARAEAHGCQIVVFDEPTSSLSKDDAAKFFELVRRLRAQGKTVFFISHFLEEVRAVCDRVLILRDGELVADTQIAEIDDDQIVRSMVGREVTDFFPRSPRAIGEELLAGFELFGKSQKPNGVTIKLRRGEILGIAGLNGAGRSELLRVLMGLDAIVSGRVRIKSHQGGSIASHWRTGMGIVSEDRKMEGLALSLSIHENLNLPQRRGLWHSPKNSIRTAEIWIGKFGVKCRNPQQVIGLLSGGNQQKVAISRLLAANCDVLLLDEPTKGIDIGSKSEIYRLIDEAALDGKAILVVSSYLPELMGICDRVAVMSRGVLSDFFPVETVTPSELMEICVR